MTSPDDNKISPVEFGKMINAVDGLTASVTQLRMELRGDLNNLRGMVEGKPSSAEVERIVHDILNSVGVDISDKQGMKEDMRYAREARLKQGRRADVGGHVLKYVSAILVLTFVLWLGTAVMDKVKEDVKSENVNRQHPE